MPLANKDANKLNQDASQVINFIALAQDSYFSKNGEYFQLLLTPDQPFDMSLPQDLEVRHPTDERWVEDKITEFIAQMPFQVEVVDYKGGISDTTRGYRVIFTATVGSETYRREVDSLTGDTDWQLFNITQNGTH